MCSRVSRHLLKSPLRDRVNGGRVQLLQQCRALDYEFVVVVLVSEFRSRRTTSCLPLASFNDWRDQQSMRRHRYDDRRDTSSTFQAQED